MSHTTTLKAIKITSVKALEAAVEDLKKQGIKCDLVQDQKPRMYYQNQHQTCPYVLKLHDCKYDVGFDKQVDGSYLPVCDLWGNHIKEQLGAQCQVPQSAAEQQQHAMGRLFQAYGLHAAMEAATMQGHTVLGHTLDDKGNIRLQVHLNN